MSRYRNVTILVAILFVQVLGLAVQVKRRSSADESTRVIRLWTVSAVTPLEKALVWCQNGLGGIWRNYVYLRGVRQENRDLKFEIERLRLEQVRLSDDAQQARRLQALLGFKETYIAKTVAAQVIGSSGSEQSRSIYIDKGTSAGVDKDMAVITADGLVGKVLRAFGSSAQVLLINDQSSGVGVILDKSRLQGVIKGTASGEVIVEKVMTDEQVTPGERIVTSGGDQIFPKGITVGTVMKVHSRRGPVSQHPGKAVRQPEPPGRSSGDHEKRGSRAFGGGNQFSPGGGHSDPASAFGPGQAAGGAPASHPHLRAPPHPSGRTRHSWTSPPATPAVPGVVKPVIGHKPAPTAKPATGAPPERVISQPVVSPPGSSAGPSKPGSSQPGTAEDKPH